MKRFLLLTLPMCILQSNITHAQSVLEPCREYPLSEYYQGIEKRVDVAAGAEYQIALTTIPSFFPESAVRLVDSEIYYVKFKPSLWATGNSHMDFVSPKINIKVYHSPISQENASKIVRIYSAAISSVREQDDAGGLDGTSYYFRTPEAGCGSAWSPEPETDNAILVQLLELLAKHATLSRPQEMKRSEGAISKMIEKIEAR
ncbi:MAG: hypothetical protein LBE62_05280 [Azonexus sp.]|jgi:hypothetical protein|nr:hypothetical protein [Azonexus sp.]